MSSATSALADAPCVGGLPYDGTYDGVWFTGGSQFTGTHSGPAARGNIRTYNGFVAAAAEPFTGINAAWVAVAGESPTNPGVAVGAQVGWAKDASIPHLDPVWFFQWTFTNGQYAQPQFFNVIFPPTVYTYEVNTTPGANGGKHYNFRAGGALLGSSIELFWNPNGHEAFSEVQNFTGDQLPGDRTAHVTYRSVQWSPDSTNWNGSALIYVKGDPGVAGHPDRGNSPYFFDQISWTDGSNFDTWDNRCP